VSAIPDRYFAIDALILYLCSLHTRHHITSHITYRTSHIPSFLLLLPPILHLSRPYTMTTHIPPHHPISSSFFTFISLFPLSTLFFHFSTNTLIHHTTSHHTAPHHIIPYTTPPCPNVKLFQNMISYLSSTICPLCRPWVLTQTLKNTAKIVCVLFAVRTHRSKHFLV